MIEYTMISKKDLPLVINGLLRCIGYEYEPETDKVTSKRGINNGITRSRNGLEVHPNTLFEFMDESKENWANLNAVLWHKDGIIKFVVKNNFVQKTSMWYSEFPLLRITYDPSDKTGSFLYRYHGIVGRIDNKELKANRIPKLIKHSSKDVLSVKDLVEELNTCFDPDLTADVLSKELNEELYEFYGLPDIIQFFKDRDIL